MKKNHLLAHFLQRKWLKILLTMKITFLLMMILCYGASASVHSQNQRVNMQFEDASILEVLNEIKVQTGLRFIFNEDKLDGMQDIDIDASDMTVEKLLDEVFENTDLKCKFQDEVIMIVDRIPDPVIKEQQEKKTITGQVTDKEGIPLPGVSVVIKGTNTGVATDVDGKYSMELEETNAVLIFSFVGMLPQEIAYAGQESLNVKLLPDTEGLDEVVIVGYGVQKKANLTGAVGEVESKDIEARAVTNVQELLQGKTPGLNITNNSGAPGSGASINIRGTSTIGGSSGPLVIIDGVPGNVYTVNPNDIESVSVLKDAASASIYGSRAANGVLVITTKKGSKEKELQVSITSSIGVANPLHFIDFVGGDDFMKLYNIARKNEGNDEFYTEQHFKDLREGKIPNQIWYKEIFEKNQIINNNHISLSGKTNKIEYNVSGSYDYQSGAMSKNNYNRYIFKPDITFNATDWLSVRANVQHTETRVNEPQGGTTNLTQATRISPITPIYTSSGLPMGPGGTPGGHPIAVIDQGGLKKEKYKEMLAIFSAAITPLKNWNIRPMYSVRSSDFLGHEYNKPVTLFNEDGTVYSQDAMSNQKLTNSSKSNVTKIAQITTDYYVSVNEKHNFNLLAGYSHEKNKFEEFGASRKDPAFSDIYVLDIGQGTKDNWGTAHHDAIQSVFGRISYDYEGKYLLEGNVRMDGASRFSKDYRWGTFPSFSAGWNMHKEEFFSENINFISRLKLRGSWGILGDAMKISRYETRNLLSFNSKAYAFDGDLVGGAWSEASFKEDISWEKAEMTNLGLDLGLLKNRIEIIFEYFSNERKDILYKAPVPTEYGLEAPVVNALKMRNRGFEGMFSYKDKIKDFEYSFDVNFSYSKNKVLDLQGSGPWIGSQTLTREGSQFNMKYGLESIGLFQSQDDIDNSAEQVNVKPGNIKYRDQLTVDTNGDGIFDAGDGVINGEDRVVLNNKVPIRYGFNFNMKYKGFDFSLNAYGKLNNYRYLSGYEGWAFFITNNARPIHKDTWTEDNKNASYPRITTNMTGNDRNYSDFWLRKANYLKIQNVQIGYTLPDVLNKKIGFDYARVYLSGQNLGIISKYDGFDPEGGYYPLARTYSLGLQLKF